MVYARLILMRLFKAVIVLFLIVIFNFLLIQLAPGDPAAILAGEAGAADQEFLDQLRELWARPADVCTAVALRVGYRHARFRLLLPTGRAGV